MKSTHMVVCILLLVQIGCDFGTDPGQRSEFAIYQLIDPSLTASQVWNEPLESLVLAESPFLSTKDLKSYKWQTHEFAVIPSVDSQLALMGRTLGPTGGVPFVVVVGNDRIYLGAFWYLHSSLMPQVPFIDAVLEPHRINKSVLVSDDKRTDARIYLALKAAGVLIE
jgi:hypothetical protein